MEDVMKLSRITALTTVAAAALALGTFAASPAFAQMKNDIMTKSNMKDENTVTVGGAPMYATKNIVENAVNSKDHTTLVAAVKAAGLVDTLSGTGPFTVFAPTNAAFARLPAGTVDTLVKPENKDRLTGILTYHVVPGRITAGQIATMAARHGGTATLKTVQGEPLRFTKAGSGWSVTDA